MDITLTLDYSTNKVNFFYSSSVSTSASNDVYNFNFNFNFIRRRIIFWRALT